MPLLGLLCCALLTGCNKNRDAAASGKPRIVATIPPLEDWAANVAGDLAEVSTLLPPGSSPHTFDPTPKDMRAISQSTLFINVGLNLDNWGRSLAEGKTRILSVGDELKTKGLLPEIAEEAGHDHDSHDHDHDHGPINPHFWLDPRLAIAGVEVIRDALSAEDPTHKAQYEANAARYIEQLRQLDTHLEAQLKPHAGRGFVSFHNAWPYYAHRYNLKIVAVVEESAGKTPSEKYLRDMTTLLKQNNIRIIYSEPQLNPQVAQVLAREVGGQVDMLDPYGVQTAPERDTYIKNMRYNTNKLAKGFSRP